MSDSKIPIINLTKLDKYSNSWVPLCNEVRHALEEHGYFIALYEDANNKISKEIFDVMEELFDLPIETKKKNTSDIYFYRYKGQLVTAPLHESFGIPHPNDIEALQSFTTLMWPQGNQRFWYIYISFIHLSQLVINLYKIF